MNPPQFDPDRVIFVACLAKDSPRIAQWAEFFGAAHVPVTRGEAVPTFLPKFLTTTPCYLIDFSVFGPAGKELIARANARRNNSPIITAMLNSDIYPILSGDDLTIVRAPWGLWK